MSKWLSDNFASIFFMLGLMVWIPIFIGVELAERRAQRLQGIDPTHSKDS